MYCNKCGKELESGASFCSFCGAKVETVEVVGERVDLTKEPRGPWKAFGLVGFILGIVSLAMSWIPMVGFIFSMVLGITGIVLSSLGKRSVINHSKANTGLTLSIISLPVGFISYIVFILMLVE